MRESVFAHKFRVAYQGKQQPGIIYIVDKIGFIHTISKVKILYPADNTYIYGMGETYLGENK